MTGELEQRIRELARGRCEYCLTPADSSPLPFVFDHIIARQHGGRTEEGNLALCCPWCNRHKGPNIAGVDPQSGSPAFLFHPRTQNWSDHFALLQAQIVGLTATGRATAAVLKMNHPTAIAVRLALLDAGHFERP